MFKHILIPYDGSKLAAKGVTAGVKLAKAVGADVTGVYVIEPYVPPVYGEGTTFPAGISGKAYKKFSEDAGRKALAALEREARAAGVPCSTRSVVATQPWEGILKVARATKCDAISMASHGRSGVAGAILGSETTHVLAHSKVPVIVSR